MSHPRSVYGRRELHSTLPFCYKGFDTKVTMTKHLHFAGYDFTSGPEGTVIHRQRVNTDKPGDYGCDPLGDGMFQMVPSGDVVDAEEKERRLRS